MLNASPGWEKFRGRKTIIAGEVNSGKTTLTALLLDSFLLTGSREPAAVLDLAPEIPTDIPGRRGLDGVGGCLLVPPGHGVLYLRPRLVPPRLTARNEKEAFSLAEDNLAAVEALLDSQDPGRWQVLFINDASLYLQAGTAEGLFGRLEKSGTVVANGYLGACLGGGALSQRERSEMEKLIALFDQIIRLPRAAGHKGDE